MTAIWWNTNIGFSIFDKKNIAAYNSLLIFKSLNLEMEKEIKIEGVREGVKKLNKLIGRICMFLALKTRLCMPKSLKCT